MTALKVRKVHSNDAPALAELINGIIAVGGTTAFERPFSAEELDQKFLTGPNVLSAVTAVDGQTGRHEGFQILGDFGHPLPERWGDIGTYVRVDGKQRGVGTALFDVTRARARELGLIAINATIRADNGGGLAFYSKQGFEDYWLDPAVPLSDGRAVDRIHKRLWVNS